MDIWIISSFTAEKAAVKNVQAWSLCVLILLGKYTGVKFLGGLERVWFTPGNQPRIFQSDDTIFHSYQQLMSILVASHSYQHLLNMSAFVIFFSYSNEHVMLSHGFNLHLLDNIFLWPYWSFPLFFVMCLVFVFVFPSFSGVVILLKSSLYILDTNPLSDICIVNIFSFCGLMVSFIFLTVSSKEQVLCWESPIYFFPFYGLCFLCSS